MIPADTIPRAAPVARSGSSLAWGAVLVRLAVPGAVWAAGLSLATFVHRGGVETAFLSGWAAAVLLVVAAVAPAPARELGWTAVLATLILWVLPPEPTRSTALGVLLVAVLAVTSARAWTRMRHGSGGRRILLAVALALGWHLIYASGDLATGELSLVSLLAGPVLAGTGLGVLARLHGEQRVWIAGAAVLVACQGLDAVAGACLATLAVAEGLRRRATDAPAPIGAPWIPALVASGVVLTVLVILPSLQPSHGPTAEGPGLVATAGQALWILPLLLPAAFLAALWRPRPEEPRWPVLVTLGLALIMAGLVTAALREGSLTKALPWAVSAGWLAWPVTLTALALPRRQGGGPARHAPLLSLQRSWSSLLAIAAAVPAAYPWLRGGPGDPARSVEVALAPLGLGPGPWSVLGVGAALAGLAFLGRRDHRLPVAGGVALLVLLMVLHLPPAPLAVATQGGRVLTAQAPTWQMDLPGEAVRVVVLDTLLAHGAALKPGTPVATVTLEEADGRSTEWQLAAGLDTGEWAAARPDVAAHPGSVAPPPWVSWLERDTSTPSPGVSGRFLAQRYRTRLALDSLHPGDRVTPNRLSVTRRNDLPPEVQLTLFHAEVRP